ncbi:MAG: PaaI family thioesterase [Acidimicrobiia bacterium]|nr:PaaI family thioesterase [Acidimicrobiia bacterium]
MTDSGSPPEFPLRAFLGMEIERGEGTGSVSVEVGPAHVNPNGVVHGAVAFAMMDTAMGAAVSSLLTDGRQCATVEIQTRYHRPVLSGTIRATAEVVTAGRRLMHVEARTVDDDDRLVASATSTYAVFESR